MTYTLLNIVFLGLVALVAVVAVVVRRAPHWRAVGLAAILLLILTGAIGGDIGVVHNIKNSHRGG